MNRTATLVVVVMVALGYNALIIDLGRRWGRLIQGGVALLLLATLTAALIGWQHAQRVEEGSPYVTAASILIPGLIAVIAVRFQERRTDNQALVVSVSTCVTLIAFVLSTVGAYAIWGP